MIETSSLALGILLGLAWWNILLITGSLGLFILCVFTETLEGALIFLIAALGLSQYFGVISLTASDLGTLAIYIGIYLLIGIFWSILKYKIETDKIIEDYKGAKTASEILSLIKSRLSVKKISFWIIFFPVSVIKFATEDLIHYIVLKLSSVYELIAKYSLRNIK